MGARGQKNQMQKSSSSQQRKRQDAVAPFSALKWLLVFVMLVGGIVANTYFNQVDWAIRSALGIVLFLAVLGVAFQTTNGRLALVFIKAARVELRKVVWPTRHETVQTTLIVVAMVVFSALVLWGLDTFFFWLVGWLAGQRG